MIAQKISEPLKSGKAALGEIMPATDRVYDATQSFDKVMGKCKANIKAIDLLDQDQKEYLGRNAKTFLAGRRKKITKRR